MRIVDRKTFLSLPEGTVYCKYTSCGSFYGLEIKCSSADKADWIYAPLTGEIDSEDSTDFQNKMFEYERGVEFRFDLDVTQRDGFFEEGQLFAIYDKSDIQQLIDKLLEINGKES